MQLSGIKTVEQAKAMAFDAIQRIEIEQSNLRMLQARIVQLQQENAPDDDTEDDTVEAKKDK